MDVKEVYLPPYTRHVSRGTGAYSHYVRPYGQNKKTEGTAKSKIEVLRKKGPSLQKEKEIRRKLESENRELKGQSSECK